MEVERIAECSHWSILQFFRPALSDNWSCKAIFGLFESRRFTQVLLYNIASLSLPVKIFLPTVPRRCFFCGSFLLFMFRVCHAFLSVHCSIVVTCLERANLLVLLYVIFSCVLSLSHVVTGVRCGTWLFRFLIFAFLLTTIFRLDSCACMF